MSENNLDCLLSEYNKYIELFHNNLLLYRSYGQLTRGSVEWNLPASRNDLERLSARWYLPNDVRYFYSKHNGAKLFKHPEFGQYTELLSVDKIFNISTEVSNIPEDWYPIAWTDHVIGSICIDSRKALTNTFPYIYFLDAMNSPEEALPINGDFTTWLGRFLACQGEEYWHWLKPF